VDATRDGDEATLDRSAGGADDTQDDGARMGSEYAAGTKMVVRVFRTAAELGAEAARRAAQVLCGAVEREGGARVIMATGNSQLDFVQAMGNHPEVPWGHITVFHMDEYIGMPVTHPASFARWVKVKVEDRFSPAQVHYIQGDAVDPDAECQRYEKLLRESPITLTCMGIGENGHIAFNEPGQVDFDDDRWLRVVTLDTASRRQQVGEGHFPMIEDVPVAAITLTVPALLSAAVIQVVVPSARKADAVRRTLREEISPACPASILRRQPNATLFLDAESIGDPLAPIGP
jgi:glucosamine-6-phosphate deaminase